MCTCVCTCVCMCVCEGNHFYCACVYGACVYGWHCILIIIIIRIIVLLPFNVNCIYKRPLYCILCTCAYVHVPGKKNEKNMCTCILIRLTTLLPLNSVHVYYSLYFVYVLLPLYSVHVYYSPCSQCMCACTHISILNPQNISGGLLLTVIVL